MGSRLDRITDWEARARKGKYRVCNLANSVKVSCRQLERYFLREFQVRPKIWLEDLKMVDTERLCRRGVRMKDIDVNTGFKNTHAFCLGLQAALRKKSSFERRSRCHIDSAVANRVIRKHF